MLLHLQKVRIDGTPEKVRIPTISKESRKNVKDMKLALLNIFAAISGYDVKELESKIKFEVFGQTGSYQNDSMVTVEIPLYTLEDDTSSNDNTKEGLDQFDMIIDVRSPVEFGDDHLPKAINLPVLSDEQREEFIQRGKDLIGQPYDTLRTYNFLLR